MNNAAFFATVRTSLFGNTLAQPQVDGMNAILTEWVADGGTDARQLAYVLGTVFHETGRTMQPIEEYGHGRGHAYGLPAGPWHQVYDGRGDAQLTWEANYKKATAVLHARGRFLDVDLDKDPQLALRQDISAAALVIGMQIGMFTGRKLSDYIHDGVCDFFNARRIINGLDRAATIKGYAELFLAAMNGAAT